MKNFTEISSISAALHLRKAISWFICCKNTLVISNTCVWYYTGYLPFYAISWQKIYCWKYLHNLDNYESTEGAVQRCSGNMKQIYMRTPMSKCDFSKVAFDIETFSHSLLALGEVHVSFLSDNFIFYNTLYISTFYEKPARLQENSARKRTDTVLYSYWKGLWHILKIFGLTDLPLYIYIYIYI